MSVLTYLGFFEVCMLECSINYHTHSMTENGSASWQVISKSLQVVSAMAGDLP